MFNLTVEEAMKLLGVSRTRMYQLIHSGALAAEKVGSVWLVDDASVRARMQSAPRAGRPSKRRTPGADIQEYILMNRNHPILSFKYNAARNTFVEAGDIQDASRAPLGLISPRGKSVSRSALAFWWAHRSIPDYRDGIDKKLGELGFAEPSQIPFKSLGLSLSDQYWIKPTFGPDISWSDVNYFENDFEELPDSTDSTDWLAEVGLDSPDNTSEGMLSKRWVCIDGVRTLLKGGTVLGQEPYNEAIATALHTRLLSQGEFVPYRLARMGGEVVCASACFVRSDEEFIPAYYVRDVMRKPNHRNDYQHYIECCAALGVEDAELALSKTIVCDDIIANADRHWRNFGLIRNVETLEYRPAPIFDSGNSLWCEATEGAVKTKNFAFRTKPFFEDANRQLRLVNDYSWFNLAALDGFIEEARGILSQNAALEPRVDFICEGIQRRIDHIAKML